MHVPVLRKLQPGRQAEDVFPVRYEMNTRKDLRRLFAPHAVHVYGHASEPRYFGSSPHRLAAGRGRRPAHPSRLAPDADGLRAEGARLRLLIDAAAAEYGGIRTYVEQLLRAWASELPGDELLVVVPPGSTLATAGHRRHELRAAGPSVVSRPVAQTMVLPRLSRDVDAVLATNPTTSLLGLRRPLAVVVHDLRHELRPEQFSRPRRALRWASYRRSYALADGFVAVSRRTLDDLHRLHPETVAKPGAVVHHGADHVRDWPAPDRHGPWVTFGHHTNKNPALVLEAWSLLPGPAPADRHRAGRGLAGGARTPARRPRARPGRRAGAVPPRPAVPRGAGRRWRRGPRVRPRGVRAAGGRGDGDGQAGRGGPRSGHCRGGRRPRRDCGGMDAPRRSRTPYAEPRRWAPRELAAAQRHAATFTWDRTARDTRALLEQLARGPP